MISISTSLWADRSFLFQNGGGRLNIDQANLKQDRIKETKILIEDFILGEICLLLLCLNHEVTK